MSPTIGIIGAGNMGGAIFSAVRKIWPANKLLITTRTPQKLRALRAGRQATTLDTLVDTSDIIIIAVKPQSFNELVPHLVGRIRNKIIISLITGFTITRLQTTLGTKKIVRTMPNLPAKVGAGLTAWVPSKQITAKDKKIIKKILGSCGVALELKNEKQLFAITPISGCGPAFFFYLAELLETEARRAGFSTRDAQTIVKQTFYGAAALLQAGTQSNAELRAGVTSRAGVTEAAIHYLQSHKFTNLLSAAIHAANARNKQIAKLI